MEDKNLENLFAQLDAEAKTEAGTDPGAKSAGLTPEEIEMWDAVFIEELNRAIEDQEQGEDNGIIEQADGSGEQIVWRVPEWLKEKDENSTFTTEEVHEVFRCFANSLVQSAKTDKALNAALTARLLAQANKKPATLRVTATIAETLRVAHDIIDREIWAGIVNPDALSGQMSFDKWTDGNLIYYGLNLEAFKKYGLSEELTMFDKRVMEAVDALYMTSGPYMTAAQIFHTMGGDLTTNPTPQELMRIDISMMKLQNADFYLDNTEETKRRRKYDKITYRGKLVNVETVTGYMNNKPCEIIYHVMRRPCLMEFAHGRKQITIVPRGMLCTPLSLTDANIAIQEFILPRIKDIRAQERKRKQQDAKIAAGKAKEPYEPKPDLRVIRYETIIKECGLKNTRPARLKEKLEKLLTFYQSRNYIAGFEIGEKSAIIQVKV